MKPDAKTVPGEELFCPLCDEQHIDEGEWATRVHHRHLCAFCGHVWDAGHYCFGVKLAPMPVTNLTEEELAMLDAVTSYAEHRAACDKIKAARGDVYPPDWGEKMIVSGKNDEIAARYGKSGMTVRGFNSIDELIAHLKRETDE